MQTVPSLVRAPHSNGVGEKKKRQWKLGPGFEGFAVRIAVRKIKDGRTSADLLGSSCVRVLAQAGSAEARTIQAEGQIPKGVNWHNPTGSNRATAQGFCWKFILSSWLPQAEQIKVQQSTPGMGLCRRGQGIYWGTKHHQQIWIGLNSYFFFTPLCQLGMYHCCATGNNLQAGSQCAQFQHCTGPVLFFQLHQTRICTHRQPIGICSGSVSGFQPSSTHYTAGEISKITFRILPSL